MGETYSSLSSTSSSFPDGVCILGPGERIRFWNDSMEALFGVPGSSAVGRPLSELVSLADKGGKELSIGDDAPSSADRRGAQRELVARSRTEASAEIDCVLTTVPCGTPEEPRFCLVFHPVAASNAESAISPVADALLQLFDVAVLVFGGDRRVVLVNGAAETLLETPRSRLIGRRLEDITDRLSGPETDTEGEILRFLTGEGQQRFVRKVLRPVPAEGSRPSFFVLILDDITDELRTEEELRKMHRMQSLRTLVGGIAHDFNDLITAILGNISLARLESVTPEETQDLMLDAEQALRQAEILTHELSAISESAAQQPRTNVSELVQSAAAFVLRGTNCKIRATFGPGLPEPAIDANRLAQVVQILVMNAQQAMPEGGIIEIAADRDEISYFGAHHVSGIRLTIRDHGEGIPKVHLKRIFEPFYTTRDGGSGLGLTVAQSIVAGCGGRIDVESRPGSGSAFTLLLPSTDAATKRPRVKDAAAAFANKKILIMDDDRFIRDILGRMIDRLGCRSSLAADGNEAIFLYQEALDSGHPFDAVIMDLTIQGGMGGKDAVRRILRVDPEATVLVTTGLPNDPILTEYGQFGFRGSVAKPFTFEEIADALASVLSR